MSNLLREEFVAIAWHYYPRSFPRIFTHDLSESGERARSRKIDASCTLHVPISSTDGSPIFHRCNINHITTGIRSHYSPVGTRCSLNAPKFLKFFSPIPRKARSSREISRLDRTANVDLRSLTESSRFSNVFI